MGLEKVFPNTLGRDFCQQTVADRLQKRGRNTINTNQSISPSHLPTNPFPSRRTAPRAQRRAAGAQVSPIIFGAWNVRSLLDNPRSIRPERRTALIARELARFKVDIAALSETRFSGEGSMEEVGAGYTFFYVGRPAAVRREAGVAFAIRKDIVGRLPSTPQGINERLMSLRLPLWGGKFATIVSVYAPPDDQPRRVKEQVL